MRLAKCCRLKDDAEELARRVVTSSATADRNCCATQKSHSLSCVAWNIPTARKQKQLILRWVAQISTMWAVCKESIAIHSQEVRHREQVPLSIIGNLGL